MPLYYKHSFPSGHTASVFAAAITISLFASRKRWVSGICFLFACLTAYSRVYLGEHFVEDVWIGSLEGVVFGTICFLLQQKILYVLRKKEHKLEGYNSRNIEF
jgi:membrane-associated phospholipid phosphatase